MPRKFASPSGSRKARKDPKPSGGERGVSGETPVIHRFESKTKRGAAELKERLRAVKANPKLYRKKTGEYTLPGVAALTGLTAKEVDNVINHLAEAMEESVYDNDSVIDFAEGAKARDTVEGNISYRIDDRFEDAGSYVSDDLFSKYPSQAFNDDDVADQTYEAVGAVVAEANKRATATLTDSALLQDLAYNVSLNIDPKKSTDAGVRKALKQYAKDRPEKYGHGLIVEEALDFVRDYAEE